MLNHYLSFLSYDSDTNKGRVLGTTRCRGQEHPDDYIVESDCWYQETNSNMFLDPASGGWVLSWFGPAELKDGSVELRRAATRRLQRHLELREAKGHTKRMM